MTLAWQAAITSVGSIVGTDGSGLTHYDWTITISSDIVQGQYLYERGTVVSGAFVASGLQVTVVPGALSFNSGVTQVTFNAGDVIVERVTPSGTPGAMGSQYYNYYSSSTNQVIHSGITALTTVTSSTTKYINFIFGGGFTNDKATEAKPCSHALTVGNLYIGTNQDIGNTNTIKVTIWKNPPSAGRYTTAGGSNTSATCTVTGTGGSVPLSANYTGARQSFAEGDLIQYEVVASAGIPAGTHLWISPDCAPSTAGNAMYHTELLPSTHGVNNYVTLGGGGAGNTTESNRQAPVYASSVTRLWQVAGATPASTYQDYPNGDTGALTVHNGGSAGGTPVTCTITGTGAAGIQGLSDTSHALVFARGDLLSFLSLVTSTGDGAVHLAVTRTFPASPLFQNANSNLNGLGCGGPFFLNPIG